MFVSLVLVLIAKGKYKLPNEDHVVLDEAEGFISRKFILYY